ncbi:amidohydrolase family protein [Actinomadura sp. DC4]|uniref:amidohydrolase family protein n=1 Tax=Actinomadura sp. DC4 TaxID=3055069 RepID=UPI0025B0D748|nr:amidohydrolase family protein [Actinomadura sp. DC4]MDN3358990.1 amidohydrolase family protein [Actinomadura sp. DC4]
MTPAGRIDVHTHYLGGVVDRWFSSFGHTMTGGYRLGEWTAEKALAFMARNDIAVQVLSFPLSVGGRSRAPDGPLRFVRRLNEEYADLIGDHPDRFGAFASVPLTTPDAALAEIEYALDELRLDGVVLNSNAEGKYFGDPFFEPVLAELSRRRTPVFVHPEEAPHIGELGLGRPSSVIEFPLDTARNITNAIYRGVFQRHPGLCLILAHCGGALPALGWRIAEHAEMGRGPDDADVGPDHVTEVLATLFYETALAASPHSLLPALQVASSARLLFGTDFPAASDRAIGHNLENWERFGGLDAGERAAAERSNALRLFPRLRGDGAAHVRWTGSDAGPVVAKEL